MGFSLAGALSTIGSLAGSAGDIFGQTGWLGYSSAKSLHKKTLAQQSAAQLDLDHQLSVNGPSWSVEGLRKAGINPILAANSGNLGATTSSLNGQISSGSSGGLDNPILDALQTSTAQKNLDLMTEQENVLKNTASKLKAEKDEIRSRIPKNEIEAALKEVEAQNKRDTGGLSGTAGAGHKLGRALFNLWDSLMHDSKTEKEASYDLDKIIELDDGKNHGVTVGDSSNDLVRAIEAVILPHSAQRLDQHKKDLEQMKRAHRHHH